MNRFVADRPSRAIGLAAGVLREFSPLQTTRAAVGSGFDAVGFWIEPDWSPGLTRDIRAILDDSGLAPMDVEVIWLRPGPLDPAHLRTIDIGAELGAPNALAVSSDPDPAATAAKLAALVEHGAAAGVRVSLEFALFTEVRSLAQAVAIARQAGSSVLVDPLHLARCGDGPADVAAVPREMFAYAQFCDAPGTGPGDDRVAIIAEALDGRLQAGDGALPLAALLQSLPPRLPLSVELRSKALRDAFSDPAERARVVATATRRFLEAHEGETA